MKHVVIVIIHFRFTDQLNLSPVSLLGIKTGIPVESYGLSGSRLPFHSTISISGYFCDFVRFGCSLESSPVQC